MQRQTGMFGPGTRVTATYHPSEGQQTDETGDRGVSSKDKTQWNPGNTWRTEIAILGTKRQAGRKESFERVRGMYENAGKTL